MLTSLNCPVCGSRYPVDRPQTFCTRVGCATPLYANYRMSKEVAQMLLTGSNNSIWRYASLLPIVNRENIVTLGEGMTPLMTLERLQLPGDCTIWWKDESGNPTGSFKARGMSVAVSKAKELGISQLVTPTAGNAGGALAAYCARAGIKAHVFMPKQTPALFKEEVRMYGAKLTEVDGNIADCGKLAEKEAAARGAFSVATLKEPYRLEGKKTMGYEIAEQLDWKLPDVILYPTGGGTGLLGLWKAFDELEALGLIDGRRPRIVCMQSDRCDGITSAFLSGAAHAAYVDKGFTIANGLRVPKPFADRLILRILNDSHGTAICIPDAAIKGALRELAQREGLLSAPEGATLWVALKSLQASGWINDGERILMLNTGSGYKYLENLDA